MKPPPSPITPAELAAAASSLPSAALTRAPRLPSASIRTSQNAGSAAAIAPPEVDRGAGEWALSLDAPYDASLRAALTNPLRARQWIWPLCVAGVGVVATFLAVPVGLTRHLFPRGGWLVMGGALLAWCALASLITLCWWKHFLAQVLVPLRGDPELSHAPETASDEDLRGRLSRAPHVGPAPPEPDDLLALWSSLYLAGYVVFMPVPMLICRGTPLALFGAIATLGLAILWPIGLTAATLSDASIAVFQLRHNARAAWSVRRDYAVVLGVMVCVLAGVAAAIVGLTAILPAQPWIAIPAGGALAAGLTYAHGVLGGLCGRLIRQHPPLLGVLTEHAAAARALSR